MKDANTFLSGKHTTSFIGP